MRSLQEEAPALCAALKALVKATHRDDLYDPAVAELWGLLDARSKARPPRTE